MAENWCSEHETVFFKKGSMRGYAHPVTNPDGTTSWCNKPKEEITEALEPSTPKESKVEADRHISGEELGMWFKELGNRIGDGSLERDFPKSCVKIKTQYYHKMSEVTGVKFKD